MFMLIFIVLLKEKCQACYCSQRESQPTTTYPLIPQNVLTNVCAYPFVWIFEDCIAVINGQFVNQTTALEKCEGINTNLYNLESKSQIKQTLVMNYVGKKYGWDSYWINRKDNLTLNPIPAAYADKPICHAISWKGIHIRFCEELLGFICVVDTQRNSTIKFPFWNVTVNAFKNQINLLGSNLSTFEPSTDDKEVNSVELLATSVPDSQLIYIAAETPMHKTSIYDTFQTGDPISLSNIPNNVSDTVITIINEQNDMEQYTIMTSQQEESTNLSYATTMATSSDNSPVTNDGKTSINMEEIETTFPIYSSYSLNSEDRMLIDLNSTLINNSIKSMNLKTITNIPITWLADEIQTTNSSMTARSKLVVGTTKSFSTENHVTPMEFSNTTNSIFPVSKFNYGLEIDIERGSNYSHYFPPA